MLHFDDRHEDDAHDDDKPVGRLLTRREVMKILGAGTAAALIAPATPFGSAFPLAAATCVAKPELDEGPYFVDPVLKRSDIRSDSTTGTLTPGLPLALAFNISQIANGACTPLPGATVDIWQCDALGRYSGFSDGRQGFDTLGQNFLRGVQETGAAGQAAFTTIYPGWYRGRAVHIHVKIRTTTPGGAYEFTTQLFFDDALTDTVHAQPPYAAHGERDRTNARDGIFQSGDKTVLNVSNRDGGYAATFDLALDLSDAAAGRPDGGRGGRGRGRGRSGDRENV
jgi:protocatechuate 3,4-dioxygenase beta subunit